MGAVIDWAVPSGPWRRAFGYPFLLDSIRWLRFSDRIIEPFEIDSMAYIFSVMDAV